MDSPSGSLYLALAMLLLFSAFFSASETAIASVNRLRLKKRAEDGEKRAKSAQGLVEHYDKSLFTILVGNNLVNIACSAIATVIATSLLGPGGAVIATALVTVMVLTFGEILPKSYAGEHSEQVTLFVARPLRLISVVFSPITAVFSALKRSLTRSRGEDKSPSLTEEELIYFIGHIKEEGVLEDQERMLVQSALRFDEIALHEIITPRVNIVALDVESDFDTVKRTVVEDGFSRIPVYQDNIDNIIGILYSWDFLTAVISGREVHLRDLMAEPLFVHKRMKLSQLLVHLKTRKVNLAVVNDDYGGTMGIVTMEDILEELVGEIWDEHDEAQPELISLGEGAVEAPGDFDLQEMFVHLGFEEDEIESEFTTVNGWALHQMEHIPQAGESLDAPPFRLTVLEMDDHRIRRLRVEYRPVEETEGDSD